jgi:hypothetical protein
MPSGGRWLCRSAGAACQENVAALGVMAILLAPLLRSRNCGADIGARRLRLCEPPADAVCIANLFDDVPSLPPPTLIEVGIDKNLAHDSRKIAAMSPQEYDDQIAVITANVEMGGRVGVGDILKPHVRGTLGTGENDWHTPARFIEAARAVLGEIDLDPLPTGMVKSPVPSTAARCTAGLTAASSSTSIMPTVSMRADLRLTNAIMGR